MIMKRKTRRLESKSMIKHKNRMNSKKMKKRMKERK